MSANIWTPGAVGLVNSNNRVAVESFTVSTPSQAVFTLANFAYVLGTNSIAVYLNGVLQRNGIDYAETSESSITFIAHTFTAGDVVTVVGQIAVNSGAANPFGTAAQSFIATAGQTVFNITSSAYVPNNGSLRVYINGLLQENGDSYSELAGVITFSEGLQVGDEVFMTFNSEIGISQQAAYVSYQPSGTGAVATDVQTKLRDIDGELPKLNIGVLWENELAQKKLNYVDLGWSGGGEIFTGAGGALQGVAYATVDGVEKMYFTVGTAGSAGGTDERVRIVEATLTNDGTQIANGSLVYSGELNLGHGQDLTAEVVGSQVYLWTSSPTTVAGTGSGKGVSRVTWNGASTSVITTYLLCGASGSGHRREHLYQGTPCLSSDGEYLVYIGDYENSSGRREVLVFNRAEVVAAGDSLTIDPVYSFKLQVPAHDDGDILQGVCSDGQFIYTLAGYCNAFHWHVVQKYDLLGNLVREIPITTVREEYGLTNLLSHGTLGNPSRIEPEGISIRNGELVVGIIDVWRSGASVVSYAGSNWAYIGTGATVSPNNMRFWVRTTASAGGAYNSGSSYSIGTVTRSRKSFWSIKEATGAAGELPISPNKYCKEPGAKWSPTFGGYAFSFRYGETLAFPAYSEATGSFTNTISYLNGKFSIYDSRIGSDNTKSVDITCDTDSAIVETTFQGKGNAFFRGNTDLTDGAGFNAYSTADTNAGGQLRLYSVDPTGPTLRTITFRPVTPAFYPGADNAYSLGIGSLRWSVVYAGTGTINTSDGRMKQDIRPLSEAERSVSIRLKSLIRAFKFSDAVAEKGDGARIHVGIIAQDVQAAFAAEGLDGFEYGVLCYDEWEASPAEFDKDGVIVSLPVEAGSRYGVRYEELLAFIIAAL